MIKEILQTIESAGIYATIALVLFVCSFVLLLFITLKMNKAEVDYLKHLPFEDGALKPDLAGRSGDGSERMENGNGQV